MGAGGEDLLLSPVARKVLPFSFECKKHKSFAIYQHYKQAQANSKAHTPILIIEANRQQPLVVLSLDDWIKLLKERK